MTERRRPAASVIFAALAAGLLLRLWLVAHAGRPDGDSLIYGDIAKNWLQHGIYGFSQHSGPDAGLPRPTLIRLPGYPLLLALCFRLFGVEHYNAVLFVQVAFDLLTCLAVAALAGRLFGRRAAVAALWLAALCPFTANYAARALAETLSLTCIAIAFYALHRWQQTSQTVPRPHPQNSPYNRWLCLLAAALGYAILLRPEQVLLAAAILPAMLWMALRPALIRTTPNSSRASVLRRAAPVVLTAVLTVLPLFPWTLRNWHTFHDLQPLAPRNANDPGEAVPIGFQDWYRTWAVDFASNETVYWSYNTSPIALADLPTRAFDSDAQRTSTAALLTDYNLTTTDSPALNARFESLARERIAAHPIRSRLALPLARLLNMALRPRVELLPIQLEWWRFHAHPGQTLFSIFYGTLNLAYFGLATIGLYLWRKRTRSGIPSHFMIAHATPALAGAALAWAMIASIALRAALLLTLDNSEPRYTLEFFPVLIVCAAATFVHSNPRQNQ